MSTNQAVRDAWQEKIFDRFDNSRSHAFILDQESVSENELQLAYIDQRINAWFYDVRSVETYALMGKNILTFTVRVQRLLQRGLSTLGIEYNQAIDDMRTLVNYYNDYLGINWNQTIDIGKDPEIREVELIQWGDIPTFRIQAQFEGTKLINA